MISFVEKELDFNLILTNLYITVQGFPNLQLSNKEHNRCIQ